MRKLSFAAVLIGKNVLIREGIARILGASNFRTLISAACADELPSNKVQTHQPVVLIVLHTGDDFDSAIQQIELLRDRYPEARVAIVADHYRLSEMVSAFRAGANGYFVDVITCDVFVKSLELIMMGETIFPPAFVPFVLDPESGDNSGKVKFYDELDPESGDSGEARLYDESDQLPVFTAQGTIGPQLSPREESILRCLIEGHSNKSIARKIHIAEATVKAHVKAILRKIRVQNRTQAAIWAMNNGGLARPSANGCLPPPFADRSNQPPPSVETVSDIKRIDASEPLKLSQANHVMLPAMDRLNGKNLNPRTNGTVGK
jgi:DNA-binding NarL/FixJ family response regulator